MCYLDPNSDQTLAASHDTYVDATALRRLLVKINEDYEQRRKARCALQKAPPNKRDIREVLWEDFELGTKDIDKLLLKICVGPTELYEAWKCRICEEPRRNAHSIRLVMKIIYCEIGFHKVIEIENPSAYAWLYSMYTTLRTRRQTVTKDWYMDSQATMHACDSKEKFLTYTPGSGGIPAVVSNYARAYVAGIGTVLLRLTSGDSVILKDVLHVPTINKCLISVSKLNEDEFGKAGLYADARKCEKIKSGQTGVNSVYVIEHLSASAQVSFTDTTMSAERPFVFQDWYMDSGAAIHVCDSQAKFLEYTPGSGGQEVVVANGARADVAGIGTVLLRLSSGESVVLKGVLHVPTVNKCLISVSKLIEDGFGVNFEGQNVVMYKNDKVIGDGYIERGMYRMNINNDPTGASTSGTVSEARQGSFSFLVKMFSYFKLPRQFYS